MNKGQLICNYFDELIPNPVCELNYQKDYELLIAIMLSAQSTDKRVNKVTKVLFEKYNNLNELANANINDIELIIREVGSYHKKSLAVIEISKILVNEYKGIVPINRKALESFPMVGRKTVNVFLSEFYHIPNIGVDTHVTRVCKRLGLAKNDDSALKIEAKLKRKIPRVSWNRFHLQAVLFGRYYCLAIRPKCINCKLKYICKEKGNN